MSSCRRRHRRPLMYHDSRRGKHLCSALFSLPAPNLSVGCAPQMVCFHAPILQWNGAPHPLTSITSLGICSPSRSGYGLLPHHFFCFSALGTRSTTPLI